MSKKNELENYGLACAYNIAMLKILRLREKAKQALGNKFDLQEFHTVVLKKGELPTNILEDIIEDYIKLKKENLKV